MFRERDIKRGPVVQSKFTDDPMIGISYAPAEAAVRFIGTDGIKEHR